MTENKRKGSKIYSSQSHKRIIMHMDISYSYQYSEDGHCPLKNNHLGINIC